MSPSLHGYPFRVRLQTLARLAAFALLTPPLAAQQITLEKDTFTAGETIRVQYSAPPKVRFYIDAELLGGGGVRASGSFELSENEGGGVWEIDSRDLLVRSAVARDWGVNALRLRHEYGGEPVQTIYFRVLPESRRPPSGSLALPEGQRYTVGDEIPVDFRLDPGDETETYFYLSLKHAARQARGGAEMPVLQANARYVTPEESRVVYATGVPENASPFGAPPVDPPEYERLTLVPGTYDVRLLGHPTGQVLAETRFEVELQPTRGLLRLAGDEPPRTGERLVLSVDGERLPLQRDATLTAVDFETGTEYRNVSLPHGWAVALLRVHEQGHLETVFERQLWTEPIGTPVAQWADIDLGPLERGGSYVARILGSGDGVHQAIRDEIVFRVDDPALPRNAIPIDLGGRTQVQAGETVPVVVRPPVGDVTEAYRLRLSKVVLEQGAGGVPWQQPGVLLEERLIPAGGAVVTLPGDLAPGRYELALGRESEIAAGREPLPTVAFDILPAADQVGFDLDATTYATGEMLSARLRLPEGWSLDAAPVGRRLELDVVRVGGYLPGCARTADLLLGRPADLELRGDRLTFQVPGDPGDFRLRLRWPDPMHRGDQPLGALIAEASFAVEAPPSPGILSLVGGAEVTSGEPIRIDVTPPEERQVRGDRLLLLRQGYAGHRPLPIGGLTLPDGAGTATTVDLAEHGVRLLWPGHYEARIYDGQGQCEEHFGASTPRDCFLLDRLLFTVVEPESPYPLAAAGPPLDLPSAGEPAPELGRWRGEDECGPMPEYAPSRRGKRLRFIGPEGQPLERIANFSHPSPTVTLDPLTPADLEVANGIATLTLSGTVTSRLADVVADGRADITEVEVSVPRLGGGEGEDVEDSRISIPLAVTRRDTAPPSSLRPFPFEGYFSREIQVPLMPGDVAVTVEAENVIGETGHDSITIRVARGGYRTVAGAGGPFLMPETVTAAQITAVTEHENTGPGLFRPVRVFVDDPRLGAGAGGEPVLVGGRAFDLREIEDQWQLDRPLVAVAREVTADIPNLIRVDHAEGALARTEASYDGEEADLDWALTRHSPPNYFKYPAGTLVQHVVESNVFKYLRVRGPQDVEPMIWREKNGSRRQELDPEVTVERVDRLLDPGKSGVRVWLRLSGKAAEHPAKHLRFRLYHQDDPQRLFTTASIADYQVVPLKIVIVGVDGLAEPFTHQMPSPFSEAFEGGPKQRAQALSALPSITWANWTGIMSVAPPRQHGILGNSFFPRERAPKAGPFNSAGTPSHKESIQVVVFHELDDQATPQAGSLYDDLAAAARRELDVWSLYMWYYRTQRPAVTMQTEVFLDPFLSAHSPWAARTLDRRAAADARQHFLAHRDELDVMTVYFAGPDNIAHDVGDKPIPHPQQRLYRHYPPGPALPEVRQPLHAIGAHLGAFTADAFRRLYSAIDESGYLHSTLFALVADHGLHAFANDPEHNVYALGDRGLETLFDALGLSLWSDGDVDDHQVVYAPNGGMAHVYLRNTAESASWQRPPSRHDVARVARQLYIQATNGAIGDLWRGERFPTCETPEDPRAADARCWVRGLTNLGPLLDPWEDEADPGGFRIRGENGALGDPPAIFVRVGEIGEEPSFDRGFRWLRGIDPDQPTTDGADLRLAPVADFLKARRQARERIGADAAMYPDFDWPDFAARLEEMNDRGKKHNRCGDIVLLLDGRAGYLTVNAKEEFNGWHGGATPSESWVPLLFNIPGEIVGEDFIVRALEETRAAAAREAGVAAEDYILRNWQLGEVLELCLPFATPYPRPGVQLSPFYQFSSRIALYPKSARWHGKTRSVNSPGAHPTRNPRVRSLCPHRNRTHQKPNLSTRKNA